MDKEQAHFILRSFRPDGADASDPDFTEALKFAIEDRELGEWLARERAFDAEFADALNSIDLPKSLREEILAGLANVRGDFPQAEDHHDAKWMGAIASISAPSDLRAAILAAMERTVCEPKRISPYRRWILPLSAAAAVTLGFLLLSKPSSLAVSQGPSSMDKLEAEFIKTYESPFFHLEQKKEDVKLLVAYLQENGLPCPSSIPPGLNVTQGLGCCEIEIDGKRGSLVCFRAGDHGVVHLVVFRREDVEGSLPCIEHPIFATHGAWNMARWSDTKHVFLAMNSRKDSELSRLF
jgi:hypothetical protein